MESGFFLDPFFHRLRRRCEVQKKVFDFFMDLYRLFFNFVKNPQKTPKKGVFLDPQKSGSRRPKTASKGDLLILFLGGGGG